MGKPWFGVLILLCALAYIPLLLWAQTGSWRHALYALRSYLKIMFWMAVIGGGFGLLMAGSEWFSR